MARLASSLKIVQIKKESRVAAVLFDVNSCANFVIGARADGDETDFAEWISDENLCPSLSPRRSFV
jgi:hypothetical protein